jgi:hypothetical protein
MNGPRMNWMLVLLAVAALAVPAIARAKGPSHASIDGPGTGGGIDITSNLEPGSKLMDLSTWSGFFPAVFRQTPDPMLDARPLGDLGPKYTVTYTVPGPDNETFTIKQDLYPYVKRGPITYTEPGQKIFARPDGTRGGWYVADIALYEFLVDEGLPATAPSQTTADDTGLVSTGTALLVLAATACLLPAAVLLLRRRARPSPAA